MGVVHAPAAFRPGSRTVQPRPGRGGRGSGLVEVMVAALVAAVALVGFANVIFQSQALDGTAREEAIALNAARQRIERLYGETTFAQVFARYNAAASDDPGGPGTAPGPDFPVPGLPPQAPDADGQPGRIEFPAPAGSPAVLREDLPDSLLGTPMDLDGDGVIDDQDHAGDYRILPVRVTISWRSGKSSRTLTLQTWLED